MRNGYRHPLAGIILMVLVVGVISVVLSRTGQFIPAGRAVVLMVLVATAAAGLVVLVLTAVRRAGVHRLAELRTWPQKNGG